MTQNNVIFSDNSLGNPFRLSRIDHSLTAAATNSALFSKKMNMPKTVQTQTIEQSLFVVHKNPHFPSYYVRVFYMRATFSVINIRPNNILYQALFVYCLSQTNVPQTVVQRNTTPLKRRHTQSVARVSVHWSLM